MTPRPSRFMVGAWLGAIVALGLADWLLNRRHDGSTLSEATRYLFRTDAPAGKAAFTLSWAALTAWLIPHICRTPRPEGAPQHG